jgi:FkbM family methyltransferase
MATLLSAAKDVATILRDDRHKTRTMLVSYAKLLATQAASRSIVSRRPGPKRIVLFGRSIEYLDLTSLLHMVREIYIEKHYAFDAARDDPKVIDAGANIGIATLFIKQTYPRARIIAFEPEPLAFAALERNIRANALKNVTAVNKAIAGRRGSAVLLGHPYSLVSSLKGGRGTSTKSSRVETVSLSSYVDEEIDFLKLDVEGVEVEIIENLAMAGKLHLIRQLVCEYHHHLESDDDALSRFLRTLEETGFGYQLLAGFQTPFRQSEFQDVLVYGYRTSIPATVVREAGK